MSLKILLVEDSHFDANLTTISLKNCRIDNQVLHASDGGVALLHIATASDIALILLDLELRVVHGLEFLTLLRADPRNACLPVIILSGSVDPGNRELAEALSISSYVVKNPDITVFSKMLCNAIEPFQQRLAR